MLAERGELSFGLSRAESIGSPLADRRGKSSQIKYLSCLIPAPCLFQAAILLGVADGRQFRDADFIHPPDGLGDGYRVETRIVTLEGPDVLKIPGSATFASAKAGASSLSTTVGPASAPSRSVLETKPRQKFSVELASEKT